MNSPDRHPFEVSAHSVHLALIDADVRPIIAERFLGVVQAAGAIPVSVVGDLCRLLSMTLTNLRGSVPWSSHVAIQAKSLDRSCRSGSVRYYSL